MNQLGRGVGHRHECAGAGNDEPFVLLDPEDREVEEWLMALRRRLPPQYDNRLLYVLGDPGDLHPASQAMRRTPSSAPTARCSFRACWDCAR